MVCPLTARELPLAIANLKDWATRFGAHLPKAAAEAPAPPRLVFSFNCVETPEYRQALVDEFHSHALLSEMFSGIEVRFCDLPAEKDIYVRNSKELASPFGNKAGPNFLFYETMRGLKGEHDFVLLMETDCQPILAHWLQRLEKVCSQNEDAWVIGSHYRGASPLHWTLARHINGNALYHLGDPAFWEFLDGVLWPWMLKHISEVDADLAYDCAWETFLHRPDMQDPAHYDWMISRQLFDRFRISGAIVNIAGFAEQRGDYAWTRKDVLQRYPGAVMVHGPLASGTQHVKSGIGLGRVRHEGEVTIGASETAAATLPPKALIERSIWIPGGAFEPGMALRIAATFTAPLRHGLKIDVRDANGKLLASGRNLRQPDKDVLWCNANYTFTSRHAFVRVSFLHYAAKDAAPGEQEPLVIAKGIYEISRDATVTAKTRELFG